MLSAINLDAEFAKVTEYWSPRVVAIANGQYLKIARVKSELVWHAHADEDELFMVHRGAFGLKFRDGSQILLRPGDVHVVPRGVEHLPFAEEETLVVIFEPAATKHTGDVTAEQTRSIEDQVAHLQQAVPRAQDALPARQGSLVEFFLASPLHGADIDLERVRSLPRDIDM